MALPAPAWFLIQEWAVKASEKWKLALKNEKMKELMKRLKIGLVEIGIFASSVVVMGLVFWFLSLTFFGSSQNGESRLLVSVSPAQKVGIPSSVESALPVLDQAKIETEAEPPSPMEEAKLPEELSTPARTEEDAPSAPLVEPVSVPV